tara:strand:- start:4966 stop:5139 length:174 start_codon:yes stop_codon:yes gene_type:complete
MTSEMLKKASEILRANYPTPMVSRTVDVYHSCTAIQRQILYETSKMPIKRLHQVNPR